MTFAVANDEAFNFTYRANVDALRAEGEVVFFSPIRDSLLPPCDLLYLPGGYPELFTGELTANASMRHSIRDYAVHGGRVFAECGGFMYLCHDIDGSEMCGVLPLHATMDGARLHLGYRQIAKVRVETDDVSRHPDDANLLFPIPYSLFPIRGHEFHYSQIVQGRELPAGITVSEHLQQSAQGRPVSTAIYRYGNVIAGYTHWYWAESGFTDFINAVSASLCESSCI